MISSTHQYLIVLGSEVDKLSIFFIKTSNAVEFVELDI